MYRIEDYVTQISEIRKDLPQKIITEKNVAKNKERDKDFDTLLHHYEEEIRQGLTIGNK